MNRIITKFCKIRFMAKTETAMDIISKCYSAHASKNDFNNFDYIKKNSKDITSTTNINVLNNNTQKQSLPGPELIKQMKIGSIVVRGVDWKWGKQDKSMAVFQKGKVIRETDDTGWVRVQWEHGYINSYRMGSNNKYDLDLAPPGSTIISEKVVTFDDEFEFEEAVIVSESVLNDSNYLDDLIPNYYENYFPYQLYYDWLNYEYNLKNTFPYREFGFTTSNEKFLRYRSFENHKSFKAKIVKAAPHKIHIGPIYTQEPRHRFSIPITPMHKEVIFDIDMNHYNNVRTCCIGNDVCKKCWNFLAVAVKILERAFREDFGYKNILWVYSGRRGIHCWVCDDNARVVTEEQRINIANYLQVVGGRQKPDLFKGENKYRQHVRKSTDIALDYMKHFCIEQDFFNDSEAGSLITRFISDIGVRLSLPRSLRKCSTSLSKWETIYKELSGKYLDEEECSSNISDLEKIVLELLYPRLDINVTKPINHLLKSPFSIHPQTGNVCVPIPPSFMADFDPNNVPNISKFSSEIKAYDLSHENNNVPLYMKTSIKEYIEYFDEFVSTLKCNQNVR